MDIIVKNRDHIEQGYWRLNSILISICAPDMDYATYCTGYTDVLRLKFYDLSSPCGDLLMMNEDHANQVVDFVNKHKDKVDIIVVNCDAGMSRSAGCAAAIAKYLNNDDSELFKTKPCLNKYVYNLVLNTFHKENNYD